MKKIIKYFKDVLSTLEKIEAHLSLLSKCVYKNNHYGDEYSISQKHWSD